MASRLPTLDQTKLAIELVAVVGKMIAYKKEMPSGELYAELSSRGITLAEHESIVNLLVRAGLITNKNHLLTWIGPEAPNGIG